MTRARRRTTGAAAVRALRRAARAWLHAHRDAHRDAHAGSAWMWRYGPGLGPTAPIHTSQPAPDDAAPHERQSR
jgi:hypothetical protein